ncbi:hypothetical protein ACWFRC_20445 [Bacillus cereus]
MRLEKTPLKGANFVKLPMFQDPLYIGSYKTKHNKKPAELGTISDMAGYSMNRFRTQL